MSPSSRIGFFPTTCAPIGRLVIGLAALGLVLAPAPARAAATAADTWASVQKYIAIHPGTSVSVWNTPERSQITGGAVAMTPVGDGTYEYVVGLTAGQTYNYLFWANPGGTAVGGLQAWNEYYDIVPTSGLIRCSLNGITYNDTSAYYGSVNYDARRILAVGSNRNPGDTIWVFNNWGETPGTVAGLSGYGEGESTIRLTWTGVYGFWGTGGEAFKAADVLAGGRIQVWRSATPYSGYTLRGTVEGRFTTFVDTNLAPGSYYYYLRPFDAYNGSGATDSFLTLSGSDSPAVAGYKQCTTALPVRSFFIVRDADWEVIERQGGLAFLSHEDDPPWGAKIPVSMVRVELPAPRPTLVVPEVASPSRSGDSRGENLATGRGGEDAPAAAQAADRAVAERDRPGPHRPEGTPTVSRPDAGRGGPDHPRGLPS